MIGILQSIFSQIFDSHADSADLRRTRIVDFAFGLVLLWDPKGSVVVNAERSACPRTDAFIPRRRVYRPDGSEGEATRKFCVSLRSLREAKG